MERERTDRPRPHHAVVPGLAPRAAPGNRRGRPREALRTAAGKLLGSRNRRGCLGEVPRVVNAESRK